MYLLAPKDSALPPDSQQHPSQARGQQESPHYFCLALHPPPTSPSFTPHFSSNFPNPRKPMFSDSRLELWPVQCPCHNCATKGTSTLVSVSLRRTSRRSLATKTTGMQHPATERRFRDTQFLSANYVLCFQPLHQLGCWSSVNGAIYESNIDQILLGSLLFPSCQSVEISKHPFTRSVKSLLEQSEVS